MKKKITQFEQLEQQICTTQANKDAEDAIGITKSNKNFLDSLFGKKIPILDFERSKT